MRKSLLTIIFLLSLYLAGYAQNPKWNSAYQAYIDQYKDWAVEQMHKYNIPASITLAQGLLESGAGKSSLARYGNNHFGIKCHDWTGRTMYKDDDMEGECFRVYDSAYESFEDHSKFLQKKRYSRLFHLKPTDYKGWAHGLKACGYATSPTYAPALIGIIETYKLYQYDKGYKPSHSHASHHGNRHHGSSQAQQNAQRPIFMNNGVYYVVARRGDTFRSIAREMDLTEKRLAKFNERDRRDGPREGEMIYLAKKKKKAEKKYKNQMHVARNGDSMYSIAQQYAIRLKYLYKMNNLEPDYQLRVGDRLKVR